MTNYMAPHQGTTYPLFEQNIAATFVLRFVILLLFLVYGWATVSLGTKCSNLTNRGIVFHGAYKWVRHPAYIAKVSAWWLALLPIIFSFPEAGLAMLVWTALYFLRAITEERHLAKDPDYIEYCKQVPYRFIPKVY